jgi:hypothetical protein
MNDKETMRSGGRKKGAQPGNRNGFRHGFYAHNFSPVEMGRMMDSTVLEDEVKAAQVIDDPGGNPEGQPCLPFRTLPKKSISPS